MLPNQHVDMQHVSGGLVILAKGRSVHQNAFQSICAQNLRGIGLLSLKSLTSIHENFIGSHPTDKKKATFAHDVSRSMHLL